METKRTSQEVAYIIDDAERELKNYLDANDGPLWGETQETEYQRLAAKLEGLYYEFDIPEDDRMYC